MEQSPAPSHDTIGIPLRRPNPGQKQTPMGYLRSRLITGTLVAFPVVVTLFFARFIFNLLDRWVDPIMIRLFERQFVGVGAAVAVVLVFILGMLAHNVLGRRLIRFGDRVVSRIPVISAIYTGAREVTKAFSGDRTKNFRRVVLVPFAHAEAYVAAFVTAEFDAEGPLGRERMVAVFLPTTPNPTTGFYLVYPARLVRNTSLSIEEAARMVISGGLVAPDPDRMWGKLAVSDRSK